MADAVRPTTIDQNRELWNTYRWRDQGDEWSNSWGGPDYEWWGAIFPRLHEFLPTGTLLEIAPGHGRWTRYLVYLCERLIGVDLAANCVEACRKRFAEYPHASFHGNDGKSLDVVPEDSIDFAFSFDSLVHAERDVLECYLHELARKLAPDGVGFIHHSNLAQYIDPETGELPFPRKNWRGVTVSAPVFDQLCREAGLSCIGQEVVNWEMEQLNDCFSLFTRPGSRFDRPNRMRENPSFMTEAAVLKEIAAFYGPPGFPNLEPTPASERAARLLGAKG